MARFSITLDQAADFVLQCLEHMRGGELFVPKIPSYRILDVAKAINPSAQIEVIGIRSGEKLHECIITRDDARNATEFDDHSVIQPDFDWWRRESYRKDRGGKPCDEDFSYVSDTNTEWLGIA
jgi:UDP-N-acetylglucosamine 4,6-dehydratase